MNSVAARHMNICADGQTVSIYVPERKENPQAMSHHKHNLGKIVPDVDDLSGSEWG